MKKNFKKSQMLMLLLICLIILPSTVNAAYFTNQKGVDMTQTEYEKIVQIFSENRANIITQEEFDLYKSATILDSEAIYQKTVYQNGEALYDQIVTEEEYNNSNETNSCGSITRDSDSGYFETSYKKLSVSLIDASTMMIMGNLTWKQVPVCRSYDVFAFRTWNFNYSNVVGVQYYYVGNNGTSIDYNSNSAGYKSLSNGAGFSMNLKDDSNITSYDMGISAELTFSSYNNANAYLYTSYQHAQDDVTRDQSMSYTLSAGGLGAAIYYSDTSIRNKYDGMTGVSLSTPVA